MTGRAAWEAARAAALKPPRAADPQAAVIGGPAAPAYAAAMMARCATKTGEAGGEDILCGAPLAEHHIGEINGEPGRTYCTRQEGPRRCPCHRYTPETERDD